MHRRSTQGEPLMSATPQELNGRLAGTAVAA